MTMTLSGDGTITGLVAGGLPNATVTADDLASGAAVSNIGYTPTNQQAENINFRNRIINGDMRIDQRNAGASVTITDTANFTYTLDRWAAYANIASKFSVQQNVGSVTPPVGFTNYVGATSLAETSLGASDQYSLSQQIEGLNVADLGWGTANAKTVTLSFWVRSSLTGTFGGVFTNSALNRGYGYTYTINSADTWEQKSVTIPGDTSGTWLTTNGVGIRVYFGLGVGSTLSAPVGSWSAGGYRSATGATSVVGTDGATFYITGVQLEVGSVATPFERRPYGQELQLCQRYYQKSWNQESAAGTASHIGGIHVVSWGDGNASGISWQVPMRANPTVTFYPTDSTSAGNVGSAGIARAASAIYPSQRGYSFIQVSSGAANDYTRFQYIASAEL
jgi:hypothetical protein